MKTRERQKLQKELIKTLLENEFSSEEFRVDLREIDIYSDRILLPFYASSTRGDYFTIDPSIRLRDVELSKEILKVISRSPFNVCGIFPVGAPLIEYLDIEELVKELTIPGKSEMYGTGFQLRIFGEDDMSWLINWYGKMMKELGWYFIDILSDNFRYYEFCRMAYSKYFKTMSIYKSTNSKEFIDSGIKLIGVEYYSLVSSIYIGAKNGYEGIEDYIDAVLSHYLDGTIYSVATLEIIDHFKLR